MDVIRIENQGPTSPLSVPEDDPSLQHEDRSISTSVGTLDIYVTRPLGDVALPGVLYIHDRQGLTAHNRDVPRRLAKQGYVVVAPDLLTSAGGVRLFPTEAERVGALRSIGREVMVTQLHEAFNEMASMEGVDPDRLGCIGFCFGGGGLAWQVATDEPSLRAAVVVYGRTPSLELVPKINAAVLGIYGELDPELTTMGEVIAPVMESQGKTFEREVYAGAMHAFYNDTYADRYHPEAAVRAWERVTEFLDRYLRE